MPAQLDSRFRGNDVLLAARRSRYLTPRGIVRYRPSGATCPTRPTTPNKEDPMPNTEKPRGEPAIRTIAMPADANPAGDIFGGWLMSQMDLAAGNVAARRARCRCATVSVDRITFLHPVYIGDEVSLYAELTRVGRTSMSIQVHAWRRSRDGEEQVKVTDASFVFVALDQGGRPRIVPPVSSENAS